MRSQAIFEYIISATTLTIDLMTPKSNQFIGSARYMHVLSLMVIRPSVLEIMRSPERDVQMDGQPENIMPLVLMIV